MINSVDPVLNAPVCEDSEELSFKCVLAVTHFRWIFKFYMAASCRILDSFHVVPSVRFSQLHDARDSTANVRLETPGVSNQPAENNGTVGPGKLNTCLT